MKKILLLLLVSMLNVAVYSQTSFSQTASNPSGHFWYTGSDTMNLTLSKGYLSQSFQPNVAKDSGTVAGVVKLYYSVNGSTYIATGDSLTLTNQTTNSTIWTSIKQARYWKIIVSGGTAGKSTCSAKYQQGY